MRESRHCRTRRLSELVGLLVLVPVLLVVPAGRPLCAVEPGGCEMEGPGVPPGAHCALAAMAEASGSEPLPCCVGETSPEAPSPGMPGKVGPDPRSPLKAALSLPAIPGGFAAPPGPAVLPSTVAVPAAPAVPLYTLLSTLLS